MCISIKNIRNVFPIYTYISLTWTISILFTWTFSFCLSWVFVPVNFFWFLHLKLKLLPKFEVRATFQNFWVFDFGYRAKSKTRLTFKFLSHLIFCHFWILCCSYCQNLKWKNTYQDFRVFDFEYRTKSKTRKPRKFSIFLLEA